MKNRGTGRLSIVGTPIGNLADLSPRAIEVLSKADAILAEDTRVTGKLLGAFNIHTPLERCDRNVIERRTPALIARLAGGEHLAFTSDAGMPGVSDPGAELVDAVRACDEDIVIEVIPGPTALSAAFAISGFQDTAFYFGGFLPRKGGERARLFASLAALPATLIFYESPNRVVASLASIAQAFPTRRVCLARELTKVHEEVLRGRADEIVAQIDARGGALKGEMVLLVEAPSDKDRPAYDEEIIASEVRELISSGISGNEIAKACAKRYRVAKRVAYDAMCGTADADDVPYAVARAIIAETSNDDPAS